MATAIRLMRMGRKKVPCYRVVVLNSRKPRDGACIENLGIYHPAEKENQIKIKTDRYDYWLGLGAVPSDTVRQIVAKARRAS